MEGEMVSIYVLPTVEGVPARAIVGEATEEEGIEGRMATWSSDMGTWMILGAPVPQDLADAISEHAGNLGVEGF